MTAERLSEWIANLTVQKELSPYLRRIYQCIMDESKKYEREHMGL